MLKVGDTAVIAEPCCSPFAPGTKVEIQAVFFEHNGDICYKAIDISSDIEDRDFWYIGDCCLEK